MTNAAPVRAQPAPSPQCSPVADLAGSLQDSLTDLADARAAIRDGERETAARILARLAEELAEAAAMTRALPGRPRKHAGYWHAAAEALATAHAAEDDFAAFTATVLAAVAARLGSSRALVAGRPGSRESGLIRQLVAGYAGDSDQDLAGYAE